MLDETLKNTGKLIARTESNQNFVFELLKNGEFVIYFDGIAKEDAYPLSRLDLKPNFMVVLDRSKTSYQLTDYYRSKGLERSLIKEVYMDPEILDPLLQQHKLFYSTEIAYKFDLPENGAYDFYCSRGAYRKAKKLAQKKLIKKNSRS